MMNLLADFMISGDWLIAGLIALIPVIGGVWIKAKSQGLKEATNNITLQSPMPEVPFRKVERPVSYDQHTSLEQRVGRIELHLDVIQRDQANQYRQIIEAGSERELRLTETLNNGLREVHNRLDGLMKTLPPSRTR